MTSDWCLEDFISTVFHTMSALSAPAGHLPLEGNATIREYSLLKRRRTTLVNLSAPQAPSSRAQPRDLYCTAAICTHAPSLKRHLGASFFAFPRSRSTGLQKRSLHFGRDDRWKTDSLTSFFTPLRGSILRLWRAPSLRGYSYRCYDW